MAQADRGDVKVHARRNIVADRDVQAIALEGLLVSHVPPDVNKVPGRRGLAASCWVALERTGPGQGPRGPSRSSRAFDLTIASSSGRVLSPRTWITTLPLNLESTRREGALTVRPGLEFSLRRVDRPPSRIYPGIVQCKDLRKLKTSHGTVAHDDRRDRGRNGLRCSCWHLRQWSVLLLGTPLDLPAGLIIGRVLARRFSRSGRPAGWRERPQESGGGGPRSGHAGVQCRGRPDAGLHSRRPGLIGRRPGAGGRPARGDGGLVCRLLAKKTPETQE